MAQYAGTPCFPHIATLPVAEIGIEQILKVLKPIWNMRPATASRLRGRIEAVLDYAHVHGWRDGEIPARWRGDLLPVFHTSATVTDEGTHRGWTISFRSCESANI